MLMRMGQTDEWTTQKHKATVEASNDKDVES